MANRLGLVTSLIVVVMALFKTTAADTYTVGDELRWTIPPGGPIAYSTWARSKNFEINDTIGKLFLKPSSDSNSIALIAEVVEFISGVYAFRTACY